MADTVYINGVNGRTGEYLVPPIEPGRVAALAKGEDADPQLAAWLRSIWQTLTQEDLGLPEGVDPADLTKAGWAIVFHPDEPAAVRAALEPLIEHRRTVIGDELTKVLDYESGVSWREWLGDNGVAPGSVIPTKVPYYVLLVGPPSRIPYAFQYLLDIEYGVGRVSFPDAESYQQYAESVVSFETEANEDGGKSVALFGTRHPGDGPTQLSADYLVKPLADLLGTADSGWAKQYGYGAHAVIGSGATKEELKSILRGADGSSTALLFTASHGMGGWPPDDPSQAQKQGALLCQDWPGAGQISEDYFFAGSDVPEDANVHGMIAFHFACYSAGTPEWDDFLVEPGTPRQRIASEPFVANLPQRLLAHERGGALAVIGHIERAWGYSIATPEAGAQLQPFSNTIERLLLGKPIGYAAKDFSERYAALSTNLLSTLNDAQDGGVDDADLAALWIERNDAQNYAIVGDPGVHLHVQAV